MPHADNSNWLSLLAGRPVTAVQPTSVEEIPALRQAFRGGVNENLPEMAEVHEEVVLRDRQGMKQANKALQCNLEGSGFQPPLIRSLKPSRSCRSKTPI